jgi:hypothetical protein
MLHTLYALFDHPLDAARAKAALERDGTATNRLSVIVHSGRLEGISVEELKLFETSALQGGVSGAALGGVLGAALGLALLGPFGLIGGGAIAAMIFGTGASTVIGALTGVVAGSASADPSLDELAKGLENGNVLLTVDADSLTGAESASTVLKANHARVVHRHAFRPSSHAESVSKSA